LALAREHDVTITQTYFEPGHSQMAVDRIHSKIEKVKKAQPNIYTPMQIVECIVKAEQKNPYLVELLGHDFFTNFEEIVKMRSK
jgi:hypothetical protein